MTDFTLGIIYCMKGWGRCDLNQDETLAEFCRQYYASSYRYPREAMFPFIQQAIVDYITNADDPIREIRRYFNTQSVVFPDSEWHRMCLFLLEATVFEDGEYVNGFRDNPLKHLPIFKEDNEYSVSLKKERR